MNSAKEPTLSRTIFQFWAQADLGFGSGQGLNQRWRDACPFAAGLPTGLPAALASTVKDNPGLSGGKPQTGVKGLSKVVSLPADSTAGEAHAVGVAQHQGLLELDQAQARKRTAGMEVVPPSMAHHFRCSPSAKHLGAVASRTHCWSLSFRCSGQYLPLWNLSQRSSA
jgi:hypothetical protein